MKVDYNLEYVRNYDQLWEFPESLYQPHLKLVLEKLKIKTKSRILDLGCGAGHHTLFLEGLFNGETIGIDTSVEMLKQVQKKTSEVKLLQAAGENIPLANNFVALVFMSYVLHQAREKERLISETYRVLKKDGYIAILTSSHEQIKNDLLHQYFPGILEKNLRRFPSLDEIKGMLFKSGFKQINFSKISVKREISAEEMIGRVKEKCISVLKLLSKDEFQSGLETFEKRLKSKYKKDEIIYVDSSLSLITAAKLA